MKEFFYFCFLSCKALQKCNTEGKSVQETLCIEGADLVLVKSVALAAEVGSQSSLQKTAVQQFTCREYSEDCTMELREYFPIFLTASAIVHGSCLLTQRLLSGYISLFKDYFWLVNLLFFSFHVSHDSLLQITVAIQKPCQCSLPQRWVKGRGMQLMNALAMCLLDHCKVFQMMNITDFVAVSQWY